jgi:hypothetical protein
VRRHGRHWLTFSGGAWTGEGYAVSWAVADSPLGPWRPAPASAPALLKTSGDLHGPGHNSLTVDPNGDDVIVFHSWDATQTRREMYARRIVFERTDPASLDLSAARGPKANRPGCTLIHSRRRTPHVPRNAAKLPTALRARTIRWRFLRSTAASMIPSGRASIGRQGASPPTTG